MQELGSSVRVTLRGTHLQSPSRAADLLRRSRPTPRGHTCSRRRLARSLRAAAWSAAVGSARSPGLRDVRLSMSQRSYAGLEQACSPPSVVCTPCQTHHAAEGATSLRSAVRARWRARRVLCSVSGSRAPISGAWHGLQLPTWRPSILPHHCFIFWDVPGNVLAAPASALCGWIGVIPLSLSLSWECLLCYVSFFVSCLNHCLPVLARLRRESLSP